jgi:hypothetical protein
MNRRRFLSTPLLLLAAPAVAAIPLVASATDAAKVVAGIDISGTAGYGFMVNYKLEDVLVGDLDEALSQAPESLRLAVKRHERWMLVALKEEENG